MQQTQQTITQLSITLKSGKEVKVFLRTPEADKVNPQLKAFLEALGKPEEDGKTTFAFSGQTLVVVRLSEVALVQVELRTLVQPEQPAATAESEAKGDEQAKTATQTKQAKQAKQAKQSK